MSQLKVRHIPFHFDDITPYFWNPHNPGWGNTVNFISVIGPAFERYFIKAIRAAMPHITDEELLADAELFCQQEGQHSRQHLGHLQALIKQYPGIEVVRKQVLTSYEKLFERESLEFHLAYAANVELLFGPIAKFMVDNRHYLFRECDNQVAALILWHFVEEFEHRNSAIDVYNHVVGSYAKRMRMAPRIASHLLDVRRITSEGLSIHVPAFNNNLTTFSAGDMGTGTLKDIPIANLMGFAWSLLCSQMPLHKPDRLVQPEWVTRWFSDEASGKDMSIYVP